MIFKNVIFGGFFTTVAHGRALSSAGASRRAHIGASAAQCAPPDDLTNFSQAQGGVCLALNLPLLNSKCAPQKEVL